MALSLTCRRCDVEIVAASEDELVERAQEHVDSVHSDHDGRAHTVTREKVLGRLLHSHRRHRHDGHGT